MYGAATISIFTQLLLYRNEIQSYRRGEGDSGSQNSIDILAIIYSLTYAGIRIYLPVGSYLIPEEAPLIPNHSLVGYMPLIHFFEIIFTLM